MTISYQLFDIRRALYLRREEETSSVAGENITRGVTKSHDATGMQLMQHQHNVPILRNQELPPWWTLSHTHHALTHTQTTQTHHRLTVVDCAFCVVRAVLLYNACDGHLLPLPHGGHKLVAVSRVVQTKEALLCCHVHPPPPPQQRPGSSQKPKGLSQSEGATSPNPARGRSGRDAVRWSSRSRRPRQAGGSSLSHADDLRNTE